MSGKLGLPTFFNSKYLMISIMKKSPSFTGEMMEIFYGLVLLKYLPHFSSRFHRVQIGILADIIYGSVCFHGYQADLLTVSDRVGWRRIYRVFLVDNKCVTEEISDCCHGSCARINLFRKIYPIGDSAKLYVTKRCSRV